jgi:hypothetical protein
MTEKLITILNMWTYKIIDTSRILADGKARYVFNVLNDEGQIEQGHLSVACVPAEVEEKIQQIVTFFENIGI